MPEVGPLVSAECADFLAACMAKDPFQRPGAEALLGHPWIRKVGCWGLSMYDNCALMRARSYYQQVLCEGSCP